MNESDGGWSEMGSLKMFFLPFPLFLFSPVSLGTTVWMGYSLEVFVNPANAMDMQLSVIFMVFAL